MASRWRSLALAVLSILLLGPCPSHGSTIEFSSAVQLAASLSQQLTQFTGVPPLPIPNNAAKLPQYSGIAKLAVALPVDQQEAQNVLPGVEDLVTQVIEEASTSNDLGPALIGRQSSLRVMIVGDSISQGQQGDFTWRYRMWQWFQQQNVAVQFVGPYTGTFQSTTAMATGPQQPPQPPPLYGSNPSSNGSSISVDGGYATSVNSAYLKTGAYNHFANWGRALAVDKGLIQDVLQNNPADLILLELGFNDMGFFYSDCYGTIDSMETFIQNARAANPNIKIAVANVPQRTFIRPDLTTNISTYNNILPNYISQWTTAQSEIHLVEFQENYACGTTNCPAGYDGLHPNALGEYQIAQAFSKSLIAGFGIGSTPLALPAQNDPSLTRSIGTPSNFQVFSSPQGVSATWDAVYGAYSYEVNVSINGGGGGFSAGTTQINRFDSTWPLEGWDYALSVRAVCGDQYGGYTSTLSAIAHPQLPGPPQNVVVTPTSDGISVSWDPPTGNTTGTIVEYNIIYWDTNPTDCEFVTGAAFKSSPGVITGLQTGRSYLVAPLAWNENGQGLPNVAHNAIPGSGMPPVPSNLVVDSTDPTSVHITWDGSSSAAGYEVFWRNATGGPYLSLSNVSQTCLDDYFLFPGTWHYEFSVAAYNGNDESAQGPGVVAPSPASTVTEGSPGPTCPPIPSWCPGYGAAPTGPYVGGCAGCGGGGGNVTQPTSTLNRGGGSTTVIGGTTETTVSNGHTITTVVGGTTSVVGGGGGGGSGSTTVVGGTTETTVSNGHTITTVVGGTTSVIGTGGGGGGGGSGSTTVIGGTTETTVSNGHTITTVVGGTTSVIGSPTGTGSYSYGMVTSTMTTLPADVSLVPLEGTITTNSWLTTTRSGGSTTIVPVILPCPTCQPEIVFGAPEIPNVEFDWPQLPHLSPFHLPCIKIFGRDVAGSCPKPKGPVPVNDGPPPAPLGDETSTETSGETSSSSVTPSSRPASCRYTPKISATVSTVTITGSTGTPTTTTPPKTTPPPSTTSYISCSTQNEDPDQGINTAYCVCSGSTVPISTNSNGNSCAYTTQPTSTISVNTHSAETTITANCVVCTIYGESNEQCSSISGCTPTHSRTPTPTTTTPTTGTSTPTPSSSGVIVYSDDNCQNPIGTYSYDEIAGKCVSFFPEQVANSFNVTVNLLECGCSGNCEYQLFLFYDGSSDSCPEANEVGGGCGGAYRNKCSRGVDENGNPTGLNATYIAGGEGMNTH